jgi:hypothetical protein
MEVSSVWVSRQLLEVDNQVIWVYDVSRAILFAEVVGAGMGGLSDAVAVALGSDRAQGFFIARPMPATGVTEWAASWDAARAAG